MPFRFSSFRGIQFSVLRQQSSVDEVSNRANEVSLSRAYSEEFHAKIGITGEKAPIANNCGSKFRADFANTAWIGLSTE